MLVISLSGSRRTHPLDMVANAFDGDPPLPCRADKLKFAGSGDPPEGIVGNVAEKPTRFADVDEEGFDEHCADLQ